MNPSRRSQARRRKRGNANHEILSTLALLSCFVAPVAAAAKAVGPDLASDMQSRIRETSADDPGAKSGSSSGGLDFGMFQSVAGAVLDVGQSLEEELSKRAAERGEKSGGER